MKMSYSTLADTVGISKQALSNIMNGRNRPSWSTAKRISLITGIEPVLLMEGTPLEIKKAIDLYKHMNSKPYLQ